MKINDFAIFILTHGRANNVITYKTLKHQGYTGKIYLIVDNEDEQIELYYKNFGKENVIIFDKKHYADNVDEGNNFDERRTITHARNACFDIAKDLGITYFMQLDDDYYTFQYRINNKFEYAMNKVLIRKSFDEILDLMLEFFINTNSLSIAMSQGGDWIGGINSSYGNYPLKRKCMNSFICSAKRPFKFIGAMNEDVNTYVTLGNIGKLFFTIPFVSIEQFGTQQQDGGITDMYKIYGTYAKAFTTVMMMPSSVKVSEMGNKNRRLHHSISWKNTVPQIIDEKYKKVN